MGSGFRFGDIDPLYFQSQSEMYLWSARKGIVTKQSMLDRIDTTIRRNERITPAMIFGQYISGKPIELTGIILQEEIVQQGFAQGPELDWVMRYQERYDVYRDTVFKLNLSLKMGWWLHDYGKSKEEPTLNEKEVEQLLSHEWFSTTSTLSAPIQPFIILKTALFNNTIIKNIYVLDQKAKKYNSSTIMSI